MATKDPKELYGLDTPTENSSASIYDDTLAQAKRDQNYKSFYNTAVQLYNMKNNANKYLQNQLASQGLQSQGYGSSAQATVNSQAINLYNDNLKDYNDTELSITEDAKTRYDNQQTENDNQLVTYLESANGNADLTNKYLYNYGYVDNNGNYTDKWNKLDENRKAYLTSIIDKGNAENSTSNYATYSSLDNLNNATYVTSTGNIQTLGDHYAEEAKLIWHNASVGKYNAGDTIAIKNSEGDTIYMQWTDSGFRTVDKSTYDNADTQYTITRQDKKNIEEKVK